MDGMKANITLRYDGGTVADGTVDIFRLAASLIAFEIYLKSAATVVSGKEAALSVNVCGFQKGSFTIDMAISTGGLLATIFSGPATVKDFWDVISGSFDLIKHLQGEPPKSMQTSKSGQVEVTNHINVTQTFNAPVYNLIANNDDATKAMQEYIANTLFNTAETVEILKDGRVIASANRNEAPYFKPINMAKSINSYEAVMALEIESPVFKKGNKWRFNAGDNSFYAAIEDTDFLKRVDAGSELFGKGDLISAKVKVSQLKSNSGLKSEYTLLEVLGHTRPPIQTIIE